MKIREGIIRYDGRYHSPLKPLEAKGEQERRSFEQSAPFRAMEGAQSASLGVLSNINNSFGFAKQIVPKVTALAEKTDAVRSMASNISSGDLVRELGRALPEIQEAAQQALALASAAATAVPYVQLAVAACQVMIGVVKRFVRGLGLGKGPQGPTRVIPVSIYGPDVDEGMTNDMLDYDISSPSWTAAFSPYVTKPLGSAVFQGQGDPDLPTTREIRVFGEQRLAGSRRFAPGIVRQLDQFSLGYSTPSTIVRPYGYKIDYKMATSTEDLVPGARTVASQMWSQLNSNTSDCFKINADTVRALWFLNFSALRKNYSTRHFDNPTSGLHVPSRAYGDLSPQAVYRTETINPKFTGLDDRLYPIAITEDSKGRRTVHAFSDPEGLEMLNSRGAVVDSMRLGGNGFADWLLNRLDSIPRDQHLAFNQRGYETEYDPGDFVFGTRLSYKSTTRRMMRVSIYYWLDYCLHKWEENAIANASTINAAYIDESFPALRNRKILENVNRTKMRILIAKNIHDVDLSMVRDPDFVAAIKNQLDRRPQGEMVDIAPGVKGQAVDPDSRIRSGKVETATVARTKVRKIGAPIYVPGLTAQDIIDAGGAFGNLPKKSEAGSALPLLLLAGAGLFFASQKR